MKCGKCGTPILPGDDFCRICGTKYESQPAVETLETQPTQVIEPTVSAIPSPVEELSIPESAPITEPSIPEVSAPVVEPSIPEVSAPVMEPSIPEVNTPIMEPSIPEVSAPVVEPSIPEISTPVMEPSIPEVNTPIMEPSIPEVNTPVMEPSIPEVNAPVMEPSVSTSNLTETANNFELAKELDLNAEPTKEEVKEEKTGVAEKEEKSIEEIIAKNNRKPNIAFIITLILLIISIALNVLLFINKKEDANSGADSTLEGTKTKTVYYNGYSMNVDYNWIYTEGSELVFNDKAENWGASLKVVDADFDAFTANKDSFNEILNKNTLEMTSKNEKTVNNKTLYIFSGKYNNFITDVIISDLGDGNILKVQVLYKGEKDDLVLNKIYNLMTSVNTYSTTLLNDSNFKFLDLSNAITSNSVVKNAEEKSKE